MLLASKYQRTSAQIPMPFDSWSQFYGHLSKDVKETFKGKGPRGVYLKDDISTGALIKDAVALEPMEKHVMKEALGSIDKGILDLINPALYCFIYGKTPIVKDQELTFLDFIPNSDAKLYIEPKKNHGQDGIFHDRDFSQNYQMLPTEFTWLDGNVDFKSYINNLDPRKYSDLYGSIARVLCSVMPLFQLVMNDLRQQKYGKIQLEGKDLQVIVSMKNIHLTPDKFSFPGGHWHVEGLRNERIVASAICYYDVFNITESKLEFRVETGEFDENGCVVHEYLGAIQAESGRVVVFPNIYQHKVAPFSLKDKGQGGHRKILTFFLVDPTEPIISTKDVPPQQMEWYDELELKRLRKMTPSEWPMTFEEAMEHAYLFGNERTNRKIIGPLPLQFEHVCNKD